METVIAEYTYDAANQLLTEVLPGQRKTVWTYDNAGNIQTRTEHTWEDGSWDEGTTASYGYGDTSWGDLLTSYNNQAYDYDDGGNLVQDGTWVYSWKHGRQLATMEKTGESWAYTYDADGLRTKRVKTVGDTTTTWEYVYSGGQLVQMTKGSDTLNFAYDAAGTPMAFTHKIGNTKTTYYYATNLQGDIIAILDDDGNPVVQYTYDAWGNPMGTTLGESHPNAAALATLNPLRYRGYVYDAETGLYYVSSRYYDPEIGRFISPDTTDVLTATPMGLTDKNLFAYCDNNPVMREDSGGDLWTELKTFGEICFIGAMVTAAVAVSTILIATSVAATTASGGAAAGTIILAIQLSEVCLSTSLVFATTGLVATSTAEIGENLIYAKAGDGIAEHTNGSKNWNRHTKKRAGDKEKGDARRTKRIDTKKRNQKNTGKNYRRDRLR